MAIKSVMHHEEGVNETVSSRLRLFDLSMYVDVNGESACLICPCMYVAVNANVHVVDVVVMCPVVVEEVSSRLRICICR